MIGYVRVSLPKQAERGVSLEAQKEKIRAMATLQGAELVDVVVDGGESAKSLERPGLQRIMALVDGREVDAVVVAKLDRLTRSVKDLAELLERFNRCGVALIDFGIFGYTECCWAAGSEHHDGGIAMGTGSHWRAYKGRYAPQENEGGAGRKYLVRLPALSGPETR